MEVQDKDLKFETFEIYKDQKLGSGAFGEVFRARCDRLPCAAKVLHKSILEDTGSSRIAQRFRDECSIMKSMRHPCIVQYLGVVTDPDTGLLVLLMEIASENLTVLLRTCKEQLPLNLQISFNHDIALAIAYLHQHNIIHRDLSSNNIMIIAGAKAKVSDFGMATVLENTGNCQLTALPGTMAYMPPEASPNFQSSKLYGFKLDCFSMGVLNIQISTRRYPHPLPALRPVTEDKVSENSRELWERVPETERRKPHIELVDPSNPLLPLAIECLSDSETTRPSADEVCRKLESIKTSQHTAPEETYDHESTTTTTTTTSSTTYSSSTSQQHDSPGGLTHLCECRAWEKLQDSPEEEENDNVPESHVEESFKELLQDHSPDGAQGTSLHLKWRDGQAPNAGRKLLRGDCVTDNKKLFVIYGTIISCLETDTLTWKTINTRAFLHSNLVLMKGILTTIGGRLSSNRETTNILKSLSNDYQKWEIHFPPMPTERCFASTAQSPTMLVVAGGTRSNLAEDSTNVVEILDLTTLSWAVASALPRPIAKGSMTMNRDKQLYIQGGRTTYTCSLNDLWDSCPPKTLSGKVMRSLREMTGSNSRGVWRELRHSACRQSTLASINGDLFAFGGVDAKGKVVGSILGYNAERECWEVVDYMRVARYCSIVGLLMNSTVLIVVGGCGRNHHPTNITDIADIQETRDSN